MTRILILCGGGASSGFLAQAMRKAAKKAGVPVSIEARSESEVHEHLGDVDVVLIAPQLSFMADELTATLTAHHVKVAPIPSAVYGRLDGEAAFQIAQSLVEEEQPR